MQTKEMLGLIIALVAIVGGMIIGAIVVRITLLNDMKAKLADLEARSKERLALIEKGMDPSLADKKAEKNKYGPLLWGLLFASIGLGALAGYLVSLKTGLKESTMMNGLAMLFGGIGLVIYYHLIGKKGIAKKEG